MTAIGKRLGGRLVGRRIEQALVPASTPDSAGTGVVASAPSIEGLVRRLLDGKFSSDPGIRLGDGTFYLPTLQEIERILALSRLDRNRWLEDRFDCDDFAYVLKAEMSAHAYDSGSLKHGLCVGMVWANFSWVAGYHAVNWFIDANQTLRFIEPQSDALYDLAQCQGDISLLLV